MRRRTAWNKGKKMSPATREKISAALKARWSDDPEYKKAVIAGNTGRTAWNKGKQLSEEHRHNQSLALTGRKVTKAFRKKMSDIASQRPPPSEAARVAMSDAKKGKPLSEEHKAEISAGQKRRVAAARVLQAVEAVYLAETATSNKMLPEGGLPVAGRKPAGGNGAGGKRPNKTQVVAAFKAELREYRSLQQELLPWTDAFFEKNGCRPGLKDVQATGIVWLIERYKRYILLRERLKNDTQQLRTKLDGNIQESSAESFNSTGSAIATRLMAAHSYQANKEAAATAAALGVPRNTNKSLESKPKNVVDGKVAALSHSQTPLRARQAMQAALEYRKNKAEATNLRAVAAMTAAKAGGHDAGKAPEEVLAAQAAASAAAQRVADAEASVREVLSKVEEEEEEGEDENQCINTDIELVPLL